MSEKTIAPSSTLWTATEAAKAAKGTAQGDWFATGISIDTRTLKKGDLFIALAGKNGDGHAFVEAALARGASAAVVSTMPKGVEQGAPLLIVEDTLKALEDLGKAARARTAAKIIAVTGSVGKTGTKEMLAAAFSTLGQTHAAEKSYNNHWGVPFTLSSMHAGTDYGIFEIGMNHAGEITPLTKMVSPDVAIITTVAPVHMENFENGLEGIAQAKAEIFKGLKDGGIAIVNRDMDMYETVIRIAANYNIDVITFGKNSNCDIRLEKCLVAANGTRVTASLFGEQISYTLEWSGEHIAMNSLTVLAAVKALGGDIEKAAKAMGSIDVPAGRGRREHLNYGDPSNPVTLIDESYNASPTAMRAAFKVLALVDPGRGGRRIAILGDMAELGDNAEQIHADLAIPLEAAGVKLVYTTGSLMKNLHKAVPQDIRAEHRDTPSELAEIVPDVLVPGDVVLVKGSRGGGEKPKMQVIIEAMRAVPTHMKTLNQGKVD